MDLNQNALRVACDVYDREIPVGYGVFYPAVEAAIRAYMAALQPNAVQEAASPPRKVVQILLWGDDLCALCDDGTIHFRGVYSVGGKHEWRWRQIECLPEGGTP